MLSSSYREETVTESSWVLSPNSANNTNPIQMLERVLAAQS